MEKQNKVPMIYGYAVCLVTVITVIISIAAFVNAVIDLGDPLYAERDFNKTPSLASFQNYKMDITSGEKETSFSPDDETLRGMYEAAKADKIRSVKHRAHRTLVVNGFLIVICLGLFIFHWMWMRRLTRSGS